MPAFLHESFDSTAQPVRLPILCENASATGGTRLRSSFKVVHFYVCMYCVHALCVCMMPSVLPDLALSMYVPALHVKGSGTV